MKRYTVLYCTDKAVTANLLSGFVSGRNAAEARSIWMRVYPERKIVKMKTWR